MKITAPRMLVMAAAVAAANCFAIPASRAGIYGDSPWCAVEDQGAGNVMWECEYNSEEDCMPLILGGNRGICQRNPYWRPEPTAAAFHHWHRKHRAGD